MIQNNIRLKQLGADEVVLTGSITQNNVPILEQNYIAKMNANNGFSKQRLFRKIGRLSEVDQLKAIQDGYDMDNEADIYRYFRDNPTRLTVKAIKTERSPNIIMR